MNGRTFARQKMMMPSFLEKLPDFFFVYHVMLFSYVCMTNHFHILMQNPDDIIRFFNHHIKRDKEALCAKGKNFINCTMLLEMFYRYCNIA